MVQRTTREKMRWRSVILCSQFWIYKGNEELCVVVGISLLSFPAHETQRDYLLLMDRHVTSTSGKQQMRRSQNVSFLIVIDKK